MREDECDRLVLAYLRHRRFENTAKYLSHEAKLPPDAAADMALSHQLDVQRGVVQAALFSVAATSEPAVVVDSFARLAAWVDASLDLYKAELGRVLYPVFLHCYLDLVAQGATSQAQALKSSHKMRFLDASPSRARLQELHDLDSVTVADQLATNRTAQAARAHRFPVRLSAYAWHLLLHFLQGARLFLPLAIINERLDVQVVEGQTAPEETEEEREAASLGAGQAAGDLATTNQQPLRLQLLPDSAEDRAADAEVEKRAAEAAAAAGEGAEGKGEKARAAQRKAVEKAKAARQAVADTRLKSEIPLPEASDELMAQQLADVEARAGVSPAALPSAALLTFINTHHSLNGVAFSPDGSLLAGGFADSSLRLYNLASAGAARPKRKADGSPVHAAARGEATFLWGHSGPVYAADFSPDQQLLFTASGDGTARLWSTELHANLVAYRGHNYPVWDVASCPRGLYFATGSSDKTARIWSTERIHPLRLFAGHQADVDVVRWHPNCHYIATGSSDRSVRLWDVRDGSCARVLVGHKAAVTSLAFSPDGSTLVSGSEDGSMHAWDLAAAKRAATMAQHKGAVWSLAFSHGDGNILASGGHDETLRLWSISSTRQPAADAQADGSTIAAASQGQSGQAYSLLSTFRTKATPVFGVAFSRRNLLLAAGAISLPKAN